MERDCSDRSPMAKNAEHILETEKAVKLEHLQQELGILVQGEVKG